MRSLKRFPAPPQSPTPKDDAFGLQNEQNQQARRGPQGMTVKPLQRVSRPVKQGQRSSKDQQLIGQAQTQLSTSQQQTLLAQNKFSVLHLELMIEDRRDHVAAQRRWC